METHSRRTWQERLLGGGLWPVYETHLRGRKTFSYRVEFEASQWCAPDDLQALQWERLQRLLRHAYNTVPYYREVFTARHLTPEALRTPADMARLPILEKNHLRERRSDLFSTKFQRGQLTRSASGGSTGQPVEYYYDRTSYERRMAVAMRGDAWAGWTLGAGEFYIWGAQLLPAQPLRRLKMRAYMALHRRDGINSFDLTPETVRTAAARMTHRPPRVIVGYAHAVYAFAQIAQEMGLRLPAPQGIILSAEQVFAHQRELVERVFAAPVFNRYGCREVMMVAAECERREGLHVAADHLYVEVVRDGRPCAPGELGEILLTDLHNYGMPLIRYRVGDAGAWMTGSCACGRGLPRLESVAGRVLDLITTPSGKVISGVFFPHLLKDFAAVRDFEVVQEAPDLLAMRLALAHPLTPEDRRLLERTVAEAVGPEMRLSWDVGEGVAIQRAAKYRPVRSRVTQALTGALDR